MIKCICNSKNRPIRCTWAVGHAKSERNRRHKIAFIFIDSILICAKRDSSVRNRVGTQCDVFFLCEYMCLRIDIEKIRSERQAQFVRLCMLCIHIFYDVRPYVMMLQSEGERVLWGEKRSNRLKLKWSTMSFWNGKCSCSKRLTIKGKIFKYHQVCHSFSCFFLSF